MTAELPLSRKVALVTGGAQGIPKAAPWLKEYEDELLSFPNGKHDDQVDSTVQFLAAADIGNLDGHGRATIQVR